MQIFVIALALISTALVAVEANKTVAPVKPPRKPPCYEKCLKIANFPGTHCTNFRVYMYDACSYNCICDGFYGFHQEEDLTPCGKNKVCWNGYCTDIAQDVSCKKYGDCYVPIHQIYQPCIYQCVNKRGCDVYEENRPSGTCCYNEGCLRTGKCDKGTCIVRGGIGCSRRYYWYGPFLGVDKGASSTPVAVNSKLDNAKSDPKAAAIASSATGEKYEPNSDEREKAVAYSVAKGLSESKVKNGPKYDSEMCKRITEKYCQSDDGDKQSNEKAFAEAYREAKGFSDGSEKEFAKHCADVYDSWSSSHAKSH